MKHFLLEGEHVVPFEERDPDLIAEHRAFLQRGCGQFHSLGIRLGFYC